MLLITLNCGCLSVNFERITWVFNNIYSTCYNLDYEGQSARIYKGTEIYSQSALLGVSINYRMFTPPTMKPYPLNPLN